MEQTEIKPFIVEARHLFTIKSFKKYATFTSYPSHYRQIDELENANENDYISVLASPGDMQIEQHAIDSHFIKYRPSFLGNGVTYHVINRKRSDSTYEAIPVNHLIPPFKISDIYEPGIPLAYANCASAISVIEFATGEDMQVINIRPNIIHFRNVVEEESD